MMIPRSSAPGSASSASSGSEPEDAPGVEGVRVAHPECDVADRKLARPGSEGRLRRRSLDRACDRNVVEEHPGRPIRAAELDPAAAGQEGLEAHEPARRHRGTALGILLGARQHDRAGCRRRDEVVGGEPDPALDRGQAERLAHAAAEPGAGVDEARPDALVEAAEQEQVGVLQARLQLAPDVQARVLGRPRPDRARGHHLGERCGIGGGQDGQGTLGRLQKLSEQGRRRLARLPGPEPARGLGWLGQRIGEAEVRPDQRRELDRMCAGELRKRPGGVLDPAHERGESGDMLAPVRVTSGASARPFQLDLDAGEAAGKPRPAQAGASPVRGPAGAARRAPARLWPADA